MATTAKSARARALFLSRAIGEHARVPDAHEAGGHDMEEKAAEKLLGAEFHDLGDSSSGVVSVAKAHDAIAHEGQAGIGDGHPVSVATKILQSLFGTAPGRFGIDHPGFGGELLVQGSPRLGLGPRSTFPRKGQPLLATQSFQPREILPPEDGAQGFDGKQKALPTPMPRRAVGTQTATGHHAWTWTCSVKVCPQVGSTAVIPISAPSWWGSRANSCKVWVAAWKSKS